VGVGFTNIRSGYRGMNHSSVRLARRRFAIFLITISFDNLLSVGVFQTPRSRSLNENSKWVMSSSLRSTLFAALLIASLPLTLFGDDSKGPTANAELQAADQLFRAGKFAEAEISYQTLLKKDSKLVAAQVGLVRSMLREQKVDEAWLGVSGALVAQPDSAALLAVKGEVQFRQGKMSDAETSYLAAKKLDAKEVRAYLGLARLYASSSLYRQSYDQLQTAHEIAPDEIEVRRAWLAMLSGKERLAALETYLAGPHPDDEEETMGMREALEFLKATVDKPAHACKLVSKLEHTETNLEILYTPEAHRMRGIGVSVNVNDQRVRLLLDTGGNGIMVSRKIAENAKLVRISTRHFAGIGNQELQSGYLAVADHLQIGDLEFQDCVVSVIDRDSVVDQDGLIGANVFRAYLVDLDLPQMRLKLSSLPKRPEDSVAPKSLNSEGEQAVTEPKDERIGEQTSKELKSSAPTLTAPARSLPKDRYIAPEMSYWTKFCRIGHLILMPTSVNFSDAVLFGLDTGAPGNILSVRAEKQVKSSTENRVQVHGLNGKAEGYVTQTILIFAHSQWKTGVVTLDLSNVSRHAGTEISGLLGFGLLRHFEVTVDYRDGLIDFVYDPTQQNLFPQTSAPATEQRSKSSEIPSDPK
jgi:tetratricopeptide (TPR) repeat protein